MCVQDFFGGSGGMLPQQIFEIKMLRLAENEFLTTKFPDFSLTFSPYIEIPWHFQVFQVAGHPEFEYKLWHWMSQMFWTENFAEWLSKDVS